MVSRRGSGRSDVSYVGRGGEKLAYALDAFGIKVEGYTCADLGCNVGGFADCLLARGARRVYAVDTGYGMLAWKLRIDPRVVVMERTNALHLELPEAVDLAAVIALAVRPAVQEADTAALRKSQLNVSLSRARNTVPNRVISHLAS